MRRQTVIIWSLIVLLLSAAYMVDNFFVLKTVIQNFFNTVLSLFLFIISLFILTTRD
jgi:hypothetical protein